jgi:hypothetical protein
LEQAEVFNLLEDSEAGKLIKAVFEYQQTGIMPKLEKSLRIAFMPIKGTLDRNAIKWEEIRKKRSEAGKIGMQKRWTENITNDNKSYQMITKDNKTYQDITKITVYDNVNVNDIKENIKRKKFIPPTIEEVNTYIKEKQLKVDGQKFFEYFTEGGWKDSKGNQVKNWKQKLLTWNRYVDKSGSNISNNSNKRNYEDYSKFYANN